MEWLTMRALLMLLAAFVSVSAVSNQEKSEPQSSRIRATRNAASLGDCGADEQSGKRCYGTDFFCRYGTSQGVCLNGTCKCPEVPNRDACTCLPRIGDCHITATSVMSRSGYSCIVPDNLNLNYDVHILSVYEATSNRGFRQHPTGTSYVNLSVSGGVVKPIVLVLVSHEPIEWRLSVPSGVEIERVLLSSFYLDDSRVVDTNNQMTTVEKVSRQEFPFGYGEDSGGGNTVKLLESTVARFGPIASFRGTYRANRWSLHITQRNHTYLPVCGYPPLPVNGTAILSNTSRGVEVEYSCFTGGNLRGNQSAICLEDRSWSIPAPTCLYGCVCPSHPLNGRVTNCSGSTVTYTCNSGYANHGSSQQRCQSGHYGYRWSWPPPSCVKLINSCMCPSHPLNGRVTSCTGSTVTYTCNSGYANHGSSQQRCQSGRYGYRWSSPAPSCVKLINGCMCPSHPLNGRVTSCTGSTVTYTCNSGYVNHGSSQQRCQSGRYGYRWSWSSPSCVKLINTGTQTTRTPTAAGTGVTVNPAIAVPVILLVVVFIIVIVLCCCFCNKRHSSSASSPERHTTHHTESLQNISNQRAHSVPTPGNTSEAANSQAINPGPPCPAYAAQDLPPDYYVVSKDNPPAYQTVIPTTQCHCPANPSVLPASAN